MRRRLFAFVALALLATVMGDVAFSAASFTTASQTTIEASTSQLVDDWLQVNGGDNQSAVAGTAVGARPSVLVTDPNNNPVSGVVVTFAVASGGGSITGAAATTNSSGIATVGSWTLGAPVGTNTLKATSTGISGSPVTFTATGTVGPAAKLALNAGNNQTVPAGTAVAVKPSVLVTDANNNPVSGIAVTFAVASGGGSVTGGSAVTDSSGIATVTSWTLGSTPGTNSLTATSAGLSGSPVTFTATGTVGAATKIAPNAGNGQTATVGTAVMTKPSVLVTDANNNPVSGIAVTFAVASGGGSVTGGSAVTDSSGIATVGGWTLGTNAGTNTLTATRVGLSGSPVTFTATGTAGTSAKYVVTSSSYSPWAGSAVTLSAQLVDTYGNPVSTSGVSVAWTKTGKGGTLPGTSTTNANGIATVTFTTPTNPVGRTYTITATSSGPTRTGTSAPITTVHPPSRITLVNAGNNQTASVGTLVAVPPSVLVTDRNSNPVAGVTVTFAVASGGGSITGGSAVTDSSGIATVGGWTLGTTAGTNTLTATRAGLSGSPVTFTATGTAGVATKYVVTASNYSPLAGAAVTISAQLVDTYGNPVSTSGVTVTWTKTGTGGTLPGGSTTNANGIVTVTFTTATTVGRTYTITATSSGPTRTGTSPVITTH